ncbi:hypothetical protein AGLY_015774, partial [Aphis glycines]
IFILLYSSLFFVNKNYTNACCNDEKRRKAIGTNADYNFHTSYNNTFLLNFNLIEFSNERNQLHKIIHLTLINSLKFGFVSLVICHKHVHKNARNLANHYRYFKVSTKERTKCASIPYGFSRKRKNKHKSIHMNVDIQSSRSVDSEQSDECIDFIMVCVFLVFVSVYSITSRNNILISNFGGGFRWQNEYPWYIIEVKSKDYPTVFKKIDKNKKKIKFLRNMSKSRKFAINFEVKNHKIFVFISKN